MNVLSASIAVPISLALADVALALGGFNEVVDERVDASRACLAEQLDLSPGSSSGMRTPARSASSMSWLM